MGHWGFEEIPSQNFFNTPQCTIQISTTTLKWPLTSVACTAKINGFNALGLFRHRNIYAKILSGTRPWTRVPILEKMCSIETIYLSIHPSIYLSIYNITFLAILIFWLSFCWRPAGTWHIFLGPPFCINRQVPRGGCLRWKPDTDSYTNWIGNGKGKNDVQTHYKILGRHIEI